MKLTDLLDEAVERASTELEKRKSEEVEKTVDEMRNGGMTSNEVSTNSSTPPSPSSSSFPADVSIEEAAKAIGYSAIRYFDLKQNRLTNYKFSYDKMLDPKGAGRRNHMNETVGIIMGGDVSC